MTLLVQSDGDLAHNLEFSRFSCVDGSFLFFVFSLAFRLLAAACVWNLYRDTEHTALHIVTF